jgi:regulator of RNase E activity RraB
MELYEAQTAEDIRTLVAEGADPNAFNEAARTALHRVERYELVSALIEAGADVNAQDCQGETPLHHMLCFGPFEENVDVIRLLLASGADPMRRNAYGEIPLHWAFTKEVAFELVLAGSDPDALTDLGERIECDLVRCCESDPSVRKAAQWGFYEGVRAARALVETAKDLAAQMTSAGSPVARSRL